MSPTRKMNEPMYREWILDTIDSLRSRKARPDLERICRMVRRRHGSEPEQTCAELEKLIQEQTVLKVNYKGSISYRNAAKVHRRSRKRDDQTTKRTTVEEANHSDLSNGDSALGHIDQDETDDFEDEVPVSMGTDSTIEEEEMEGADEDGHEGSSPGGVDAVQGVSGGPHPDSAPCSPSSSISDRPPGCQTSSRSSSRPPSSPPAPKQSECVSAFCPDEHGQSMVQGDPGDMKRIVHPSGTCPWVQKSLVNREIEDGARMEGSGLTPDQLVPECVQESVRGPDRQPVALSFPSDDCAKYKKEIDVASYVMAQDNVQNGMKNGEVSVKMETTKQNLLLWSVADVASYITAAGFPEQAGAFRTQEIDGKSLLLMQRSDVLTGLSIRLGPALKIYERHVKALQRTHFLDEEDDL
ncbi:hypothetical protein UPYG_G00105180 [Umbra pygmaea]|uniref:SAM domain-containing protein n=1 Tax=Umbra pygmaea TaxID=75934 RepID=A0ABD0X1P6_UMBPY